MAAPATHSHHHHHQKQTEVGGPHITHGVHAPTLIPKSTFDSEKHAQELRAAMKGLGTNDAMIIEAITTCTSLQRQEVITKYKVLFGRDLIEDLHHELGGHLKEVVLEVMASDAERDATALRKAMKGLGTDEETLVDILATRSNGEVANIKTAYEHLFKRDLEKDLRSETSGQLEHLLFALVQAARDENFEADEARAAKDAQTLIAAGEGKWITNESAFQQIMLTSSRAQIHALADEYAKVSKLNLLAAVDKELSGNVKTGFHALVATAIDAPAYYADRLYHSMKGLGTSNDLLIRVIVSRAERDLEAIKAAFRAKYDQALEHMVQHEVSGDYRKILLALIGTTPAAPAK